MLLMFAAAASAELPAPDDAAFAYAVIAATPLMLLIYLFYGAWPFYDCRYAADATPLRALLFTLMMPIRQLYLSFAMPLPRVATLLSRMARRIVARCARLRLRQFRTRQLYDADTPGDARVA